MWHTPVGDRHLVGSEAELIRSALGMLVDQVSTWAESGIEEPSERWTCGTQPFDLLTTTQQLAVLYDVARHLLEETPTTLPLTEVAESTVGEIFEQIRAGLEMEIDDQEQGEELDEPYARILSWRAQIRAAYRDTRTQDEWEELEAEGFTLPSYDDTDTERWHDLIERLTDRILWDRDYQMASLFLDSDPKKASQIKRLLGVNTDYFTAIAPEARQQEVNELLVRIKAITHIAPF
jgi:hypothetical protein